jgi:hypothetical protein
MAERAQRGQTDLAAAGAKADPVGAEFHKAA